MTQPIVIAHRGASGYLPEHTLEAKALAYAMGADYLEQDCVLSKDDVPVVLHDVQIDTVTDVAKVFGDRARDDGRYYAIDFTVDELKSLRVTERVDHKSGKPVFPGRFPAGKSRFEVPTLAEEIEMIQGLNRSTGKNIGIYPEIKAPAWHHEQGKDLSRILLDVLGENGYLTKKDACFVQCFDVDETRRLREELGCQLQLVQLIGDKKWSSDGAGFDPDFINGEMKKIAEYADGIGPALPHVISGADASGNPVVTPIITAAHEHGLVVHPYTLRADGMPDWTNDFEALLRMCYVDAKVDGLFTDFPDRAVQVRNQVA
ncbi:MAG: glycerophosphodiester phosphodiesterase [Planctomycetaceae bacterium]|nr:glycerophosphodiester phosphodiesterase [Planctomycetaceae bacterium]